MAAVGTDEPSRARTAEAGEIEDFGPFFLKFCSYFPFNARLYNGNEWAKRQAARAGIGFTPRDNALAAVDDVAALQAVCDALGPAQIDALLRKWLARLPHLFSPAGQRISDLGDDHLGGERRVQHLPGAGWPGPAAPRGPAAMRPGPGRAAGSCLFSRLGPHPGANQLGAHIVGLQVHIRGQSLRHSHATGLIRRGVPIEVVGKRLTHASVTTTSAAELDPGPLGQLVHQRLHNLIPQRRAARPSEQCLRRDPGSAG